MYNEMNLRMSLLVSMQSLHLHEDIFCCNKAPINAVLVSVDNNQCLVPENL